MKTTITKKESFLSSNLASIASVAIAFTVALFAVDVLAVPKDADEMMKDSMGKIMKLATDYGLPPLQLGGCTAGGYYSFATRNAVPFAICVFVAGCLSVVSGQFKIA